MNEEIIADDIYVEEDLRMDPEFEKELMATFILELSELLAIYRHSLGEIRSVMGDKALAYKELFRVYHTIKGDAGYFEEFTEFTKFASYHCETLRYADEKIWNDPKILQTMSINYSLISTAYHTLSKGRTLQALRFQIKEENVEEEVQIESEVEVDEEVEISIKGQIDEEMQMDDESEADDGVEVHDESEVDDELDISIKEQIDEEMQIDDEPEADEGVEVHDEHEVGDEVEIYNEEQIEDDK